jgi:hypothetical protein
MRYAKSAIGPSGISSRFSERQDVPCEASTGKPKSASHVDVPTLHSIAPFEDGNETWLVLIGAGLFAAFPMLYAIFLPAF